MSLRGRFVLLALGLVPLFARAQVADSLTARFHQELDTRTWRVQEVMRLSTPRWSLLSSGYGSLTQRQLPGYESQWKNDVSANLDLSRRVRDDLSAVLELRAQDFRDRAAPFIADRNRFQLHPDGYVLDTDSPILNPPTLGQDSRIGRAVTRAGMAYQPNPDFEGQLLLGGSFDDQLEGGGGGLSGSGNLFWSDLLASGVDLQSDGWLNRYGDRRNHSAFVRALTLNPIGDAMNQLAASWRNRRSDLFFGSGGQVVSRVSEEIRVDNRLSGPLHPRVTGIYDLSFRQTSVDYKGGGPGPGDEMDLINNLMLQGYTGRWLGTLSYRFGLENRTYGDLILGRNQVLGLTAEWQRGSDSLDVRLSTEKWRYDSPDSLETSDRDRIIHRLGSDLALEVLPRTQFTLETLVLLDHLVNLHRERSSDNRWNRVFRLAPGVKWSPAPRWENHAVFEILANYTDYDFEFEQTGSGVRSNVFRRWSASDTLRAPLPFDLEGELSGRVDLEDRGRLRWAEFMQQVSDEKRAFFWSASLSRTLWSHLRLRAGYRSHRREEDRLDPAPDGGSIRSRASTYLVRGPFFRAETFGLRQLRIGAEVILQAVEDNSATGRDRLDHIDLVLVYRW